MSPFRIGTRGSALALWQARSVADLLRNCGVESELVIVKTSGDRLQQTSFAAIGAKGVFIKELEDALRERRIDVAVHSMKDLPTDIPEGFAIGAICKRQDPRDVLISATGKTLEQLPAQARVGTSSLRRQSQLLHARPDLRMLEIRGNVDTRIEKLNRGEFDAIVLAKAGLDRLGLSSRITQVLDPQICLPAAGQGAIGIEARERGQHTLSILADLNDLESSSAVTAERTALAGLEGGCLAAIGAWARIEDERLALDVAVLSPDGVQRMREKSWAPIDQAEYLGGRVAHKLRENGAAALLAREPLNRV
jgi:hydroxymethylbilane synthase